MGKLIRDTGSAGDKVYDLIIVGGGVYGIMLTLEASCRGLKPLLLEKEDFGHSTSINSLRIIHGGFRYLQSLDFPRLLESSAERTFFLKTFPDLVDPIDCMMPLYGEGFRRPFFLLGAAIAYEWLTCTRNRGVHPDKWIQKAKILSATKTRELFPQVDIQGLKGAVQWQDGFAPDSQRVLIEALRLAAGRGAESLNYVEAEALLVEAGRVRGVQAMDHATGRSFTFRSGCVINAAGPWCREVAGRFHRDIPQLFHSALAWNILFERPAPAPFALALAPRKPGARTYFLVPYKGRLFAGTGHAPWQHPDRSPMPTQEQLIAFIDDLNMALPALSLTPKDIHWIFPGLQPARRQGGSDLTHREVIVDHGKIGGPSGLFSISGVKFTTARKVAEKTLRILFPGHGRFSHFSCSETANGRFQFDTSVDKATTDVDKVAQLAALVSTAQEEAVLHLEDLVIRRTSLWEHPDHAMALAPRLCASFGWDADRSKDEILQLGACFHKTQGRWLQ